jgi:3-hydroxyisobutyrate dehydrogenase-like beta-hydroxyacid dehydrogenase
MAALAFVGFGELAAGLAEGLSRSGRHELRAYMRTEPAPDSQQARELAAAGVTSCQQLADAVSAADAVLAAVPASSQLEVAERSAPLLSNDCLYVDFASAPPAAKLGAAELVSAAGARYVDAAVLGTVLTSGFAVPILASGPGAAAFEMLVAPDGLKVRAVDAPPGHAALVKLIRGVYLKGRDALVAEMMLTAKRYGVEELVAASIGGPGEEVPFPALAERVLCSLAVHAGRRADELDATSQVVEGAGVDPALTRAGADTLRAISELGLAEMFDGERPGDAASVLAAIDERSAANRPSELQGPARRP